MDGANMPPPRKAEPLNSQVQQQLNLQSIKTRAISLSKTISRILEEMDAIARSNSVAKWPDILGQFSMVNLELHNIVEDIKNVSKAFVVHPKNVTAENSTILPVMLSSKLLPEMEEEDTIKAEHLLQEVQHLPVPAQIEKLRARIGKIEEVCTSAEKIIAEGRKSLFGTRQGTSLPTVDKVQAAKIQEQENLLRNAVNNGEGLRLPVDQRQITSSLPAHLVDVLPTNDGSQSFPDSTGGMYQKNTPPLMFTPSNNNQGTLLQASGAQLMGRAAASPSTGPTSFDNTTASPLQYANSPRSGANMMNTPSPQQQQSHQQLQQTQLQQQHQQQRQKMMQLPPHQQQQLLAQQQLRQSNMPGLGQNQQSAA